MILQSTETVASDLIPFIIRLDTVFPSSNARQCRGDFRLFVQVGEGEGCNSWRVP